MWDVFEEKIMAFDVNGLGFGIMENDTCLRQSSFKLAKNNPENGK